MSVEPKKEMLKRQVFDAQSRVDLIKQGKDHIVVDKPAPYVTRITLNREKEYRNALANETRAALFDQLQYNDQDPDCRVTIIRGSNGIFCSGYDIPDRKTALPMFTSEIDGQQQRNNVEGWFMIMDLAKPVISSVEGECLGGGMELAAACDIVLVANDAVIGYPAVRGQGLPDFQIYPWVMGHRNAMEIMLTNRQMSGEEAVERGFATASFEAAELEKKTLDFANRVAKIPGDLLAFNKRSVHRAFETMGLRANIRNGLDLEALMFKAPGAKMLVARRVTKPGEGRAPPPRPNSSQPPSVKKDAPISAPPSLIAISGPAVAAAAVSATTAAVVNNAPSTPQKQQPPAKAQAATAAVPRPSPPKPAAAASPKPTPQKVATPAAPTQAAAAKPASPKAPSAVPVAAKPAAAPPARPSSPKPAATAAPKPAAASPAPKQKPVEAKAPSEPVAQAATPTSAPIRVGPKRTEAQKSAVEPKKVSAEASQSPAPTTQTVAPKTAAPVAVSPAKKEAVASAVPVPPQIAEEYTDEDGIHIHLHDEINIHIHNEKSKL